MQPVEPILRKQRRNYSLLQCLLSLNPTTDLHQHRQAMPGLLQWKDSSKQADTYTEHLACKELKTTSTESDVHICRLNGGGRRTGGRWQALVSGPGRIQAVWDRSDLTQPSYSRTGHVRLDLCHTTDIIPLSEGDHSTPSLYCRQRERGGA